ncbi:cell division FtsA domain-containing protein [Brevibacillus ginsengisoli]|uniref:cell division FtsA domain-containing protein n=1 Tax=Brevibacillus ginsengisoli TaxID=363854 RepID=UPI003CF16339
MSHDDQVTQANERIFALDIGTRSVVGLIVEPCEDQFRVVDCVIQEHNERSMLDGQIHDVVAVAKVIDQVKTKLSEKHGSLTKVAVAAAGRSLQTRRATIEIDISPLSWLTRDDCLRLEFSAVQEAQSQLARDLNDRDSTHYYCVGYSVVNYYLDHEVIGSLIDQRGEKARVEVIATFLPRVVVDSLLAALKRCDLEMQALTLEPIAAIHVLIPPTMRRLNIALVDIGAGTSDIALTEEGTITAYGMVPVAGDEITDALMNAFLLDFPIAESVKRALGEQEVVEFQDILGIEHSLTKEEIVSAIDTDVSSLAKKIADKIIELNGKSPQAVMLVGGGSLTPKLPEKVAEFLQIPAARVAVRGADAIKQFVGSHPLINGPEFVTPVGIAVAAQRNPIKYVTVNVNGSPVRIFDLRKMTMGDALLAVGLDIRRLYGRPGMAMTVTYNGRMRFIPGGHGTPPIITKNQVAAALDESIADGDEIVVIPGQDGEEAKSTILNLLTEADTLDVWINNKPFSLGPIAYVDQKRQELSEGLHDRAQIEVRLPRTLAEVLHEAKIESDIESDQHSSSIRFTLNGQDYTLPQSTRKWLVNGKEVNLHSRINLGDQIEWIKEEIPLPKIQDIVPPDQWVQQEIKVFFNGKPVTIETGQITVTMNGQKASLADSVLDEAIIQVQSSAGSAPVFNDVFRFVEVSLNKPEGAQVTRLVMLINSEPASFQSEISAGDRLELYWE